MNELTKIIKDQTSIALIEGVIIMVEKKTQKTMVRPPKAITKEGMYIPRDLDCQYNDALSDIKKELRKTLKEIKHET